MRDQLGGELLGRVEQESAADAAIVFDGLQQLLFVLFAHARQFADFAFAGQLFDAIEIADLVGAPDQGDGLGPEALNLEQFEHGGTVFLQQFGMDLDCALLKKMLQVGEHALADAGDCQQLFGFGDQIGNLLGQRLDRLGGIAVGTNAEGILAVDFEQVGGFVENSSDGFVVHKRNNCSACGSGARVVAGLAPRSARIESSYHAEAKQRCYLGNTRAQNWAGAIRAFTPRIVAETADCSIEVMADGSPERTQSSFGRSLILRNWPFLRARNRFLQSNL